MTKLSLEEKGRLAWVYMMFWHNKEPSWMIDEETRVRYIHRWNKEWLDCNEQIKARAVKQ
jgi:hypothetical protein